MQYIHFLTSFLMYFVSMGIKSQFVICFDSMYLLVLFFIGTFFTFNCYVLTFACFQVAFIDTSFHLVIRELLKQLNGWMF